MIKQIINLKYIIHFLCLLSLISIGIFGMSLNMFLTQKLITKNEFKTAIGDEVKTSIDSSDNKSGSNILLDETDICKKYEIGDIFPDAATLDKQFGEYINTLPEVQKNIYLKIKEKFKNKLFIIKDISFDNSKPVVNLSESVLTSDEIDVMKEYYKGALIPFLGFIYNGDTLISKYFEMLTTSEIYDDKQLTKYDSSITKSLEGFNLITGFALLEIISNYESGSITNDKSLEEMNKAMYILKYGLGISKANAATLTEKEFKLFSLCLTKKDILDSRKNAQDLYFLAKPYLDTYNENALSKVNSLIDSFATNDYEQFNKDFDTVTMELNKNNPLYGDKSSDELHKNTYQLIKYMSDLDPKKVYLNE
jgi:hypothetical protein